MTLISELFDPLDLAIQIATGNITDRRHPDFPELHIYNYTDQVAFNRDWNDITRTCRGLIVNVETDEVLARPFPKFFNWDEPEAPRILDDQVVWYYDNIVYRVGGTLYMATRGSFASEQAKLGTALLRKFNGKHLDWLHSYIDMGYTPLFEICGPDNRIVLRYDDNFLASLGFIKVEDGTFIPPLTTLYPLEQGRTMRALLSDVSRTNSEGWVVWLSHDKPVKIKQADYIELHRMMSNLSRKEVWRQLRAGTYAEYVQHLPDELFILAEQWAEDTRADHIAYNIMAHKWLGRLMVEGLTERKDQALWLTRNVPSEQRGLVFSLLDGKSITDSIYRMIEPKGE
jgi:RNA ligase